MVAVRQVPIALFKNKFEEERNAWIVANGAQPNHVPWESITDDLILACDETILNFYKSAPRNMWWVSTDLRLLKGVIPEVAGNMTYLRMITTPKNSTVVVGDAPGMFKQQSIVLEVNDRGTDTVDLAAFCAKILGVKGVFYIGKARETLIGAKKATRSWNDQVTTTFFDLTECDNGRS